MYHYPHQQLFNHTINNEYEQYSAFEHEKTFASTSANLNFTYETGCGQTHNPSQVSDLQIPPEEVVIKPKTDKKVLIKNSSNLHKKTPVDTSSFSIEERLVAAVWAHERKRTKRSISQIMQEFQLRFGREPPSKNTLLVWERKLFSTGSVHDAPRPGRPMKRASAAAVVAASVKATPGLSLRARARALRLPRTTLRTILVADLGHSPDIADKYTIGKQRRNKNAKAPHLHTLPKISTLTTSTVERCAQGYT